jgi:crossover junction endodeoxyribonuclease RusA
MTTTVLALTLPWPPKELNPNTRHAHWAPLARAKGRYRHACATIALSQGARRMDAQKLSVSLTFYPPDRRHRDADNCLASMKAGLDGLADVLGVDDSKWRVSFEMADTIGGMVKVEILEAL